MKEPKFLLKIAGTDKPITAALIFTISSFFIKPYPKGNGENTIAFLKDLPAACPNKKLIVLWDNARYHTGKEVKKYLNEVNEGITDEKDRKINCYHFAPNAPDQNPVEDVWLRGKNFLRKHFYQSESFHQMKRRFLNYLDKTIFNFKKLEWYLKIQQPV